MARMDATQPFPADVDREAFGHWLSGFTDGEGTFCLSYTQKGKSPVAVFGIQMRADELPILQTIQSFFGCGLVYRWQGDAYATVRGRAVSAYRVSSITDLGKVILPHFDRYPLRAKKTTARRTATAN